MKNDLKNKKIAFCFYITFPKWPLVWVGFEPGGLKIMDCNTTEANVKMKKLFETGLGNFEAHKSFKILKD